jgi:hypothetical protein
MAVVGNSYIYHTRQVCPTNWLRLSHTENTFQDLVDNIQPGVAQVGAINTFSARY